MSCSVVMQKFSLPSTVVVLRSIFFLVADIRHTRLKHYRPKSFGTFRAISSWQPHEVCYHWVKHNDERWAPMFYGFQTPVQEEHPCCLQKNNIKHPKK